MNSTKLILEKINKFLSDKKAWNISVLDLENLTSISDYFIIANGSNKPHLKSLSEGVFKIIKDNGSLQIGRSGTVESGWMIIDADGIMIHLFEEECRNYYDLEGLWGDAKRIHIGE